jgi:hypothetical protein
MASAKARVANSAAGCRYLALNRNFVFFARVGVVGVSRALLAPVHGETPS